MKYCGKKIEFGNYSPQMCNVHEIRNVNIKENLMNVLFVAFVLFTILSSIFSSIYTLSTVIGPSMKPTLNITGSNNSDVVYVNGNSNVMHGDIAVIEKTTYYVIKRVIALPGDTINIVEDENWNGVNVNLHYRVLLNGELLDESGYLNFALSTTNLYEHFESFNNYKIENASRVNADGSITIGNNEIFIMGDNRTDSEDSSDNGPYDLSKLLGKVEIIIRYQTGMIEHYNQKIIGMIKVYLNKIF
ncbi:MAG: signal peptidase I [Clostridia bacterium]|jgi:signal peptidase I|nr:signal peptidase I [Clostridia bacterium]MDD4276242.1 signal peptidase I [Clostridia bacterium]